MKPVTESELTPSADAHTVVYAKDQPEYDPLPARRFSDGRMYCEWQPTPVELDRIMFQLATGGVPKIRLWVWTFNQPLQPVALEVVP